MEIVKFKQYNTKELYLQGFIVTISKKYYNKISQIDIVKFNLATKLITLINSILIKNDFSLHSATWHKIKR